MVYFKDMKWWGILLLFLSTVLPARAALSFSLESINPSIINSLEQEVEVKLNMTDLPSESYFRVAWKKEGSSTYFGYVKNQDGNWAKIGTLSSDCKNYYKVSNTGTTTLTLATKMGTDSNSETGNYLLKAHRFTSSCASNSGSENELTVALNLPTLTPSSTPTPVPTPTPTPKSLPTPTPKSSPARSVTPNIAGGPTPTPTLVATPPVLAQIAPSQSQDAGSAGQIVQARVSPVVSARPSPTVLGVATSKSNWLAVVVVAIGGAIFVAAVYLLVRRAGTMEK